MQKKQRAAESPAVKAVVRPAVSPFKASAHAVAERPMLNLRIGMIGIAAVIFLGILLVVFPLFKKKAVSGQMSDASLQLGSSFEIDSSVQTAAQGDSVNAAPVKPARNYNNSKDTAKAGAVALRTAEKATSPAQTAESVQQPQTNGATTEKALEQKQTENPVKDLSVPPVIDNERLEEPSSNEAVSQEASGKPSPSVADSTGPSDDAVIQAVVPQEPPQALPAAAQEQVPEQAHQQIPEPEVQVKAGDIVDYAQLDQDPAYIVHSMPRYTMLAKQKGIDGIVVLNVLIGEDGSVQEVQIIKGLEKSLDDAAVRAALKWSYTPPTKSGVPVRFWKSETVTFLK